MAKSIEAAKIFTGEEWLTNATIEVNEGLITKVEGEKTASVIIESESFISPAFIDFQVYGASGKLFAAYPEADTLLLMEQKFKSDGCFLFQPTLATNSLKVFEAGIDAVKDYRKRGGRAVFGLHLEGPWINPLKKGAHIESFIHAPTLKEVTRLLKTGEGVITTITLAPEVCDPLVLEALKEANIIISAGHSNATSQQSINAFNAGVSTVTHLFNAMTALHHREPGLAGATLMHERIMASIIPDGHHVDYTMISLAEKLMKDRLFAITDAVTGTSEGPYQHKLAGDKYECNGTLSGSALSMLKACQNLVRFAGFSIEEAINSCSLNVAGALGAKNRYGKIAPGHLAQFIRLNKKLELLEVVTA